jgi:site-specific DNA-methyltransferase (adenine-specific)
VIDVAVGGNDKGIEHPAMYPVELADRLIQTFCPPAGMVLDPFCGSGTTLLAARELGRPFYGFDIERKYVKIARERLAAEKGPQAPPRMPLQDNNGRNRAAHSSGKARHRTRRAK